MHATDPLVAELGKHTTWSHQVRARMQEVEEYFGNGPIDSPKKENRRYQ